MPLSNLWKSCHASVCCIRFSNQNSIRAVTATGFKSGDFIITDAYSYKLQDFSHVQILFVGEDSTTVTAKIFITYQEFCHRILNAGIDDPQGFLVVLSDFDEFKNIPSLKLAKSRQRNIGDQVALIGFRCDHENLSIMSGIISSVYYNNNQRLVEVDSTVRQGCAGSPVIHAESHEVIGIVGFRLVTLHRSHNQMMKIINDNLKTLKEVEGKISIQDIDPIQVLIANQNQIKHMVLQFFRLTDIRTAIAYDVMHLLDFIHEMQLDKRIEK